MTESKTDGPRRVHALVGIIISLADQASPSRIHAIRWYSIPSSIRVPSAGKTLTLVMSDMASSILLINGSFPRSIKSSSSTCPLVVLIPTLAMRLWNSLVSA